MELNRGPNLPTDESTDTNQKHNSQDRPPKPKNLKQNHFNKTTTLNLPNPPSHISNLKHVEKQQ
jgi:hypothetical protein